MKSFAIPFLLCLVPAAPAWAEMRLTEDLVKASILPGWRTADGGHMAALRLELAPGWKTYWRSPGEAGIPPVFDWSGSSNVSGIRLHWPRPEVFETNGMQTIGYHDLLVLPFEIRPTDPAEPVQLTLGADLGVCQDICVPAQVQVTAALAGSGKGDLAIRAALADQPIPAENVGLAKTVCSVQPIADGLRVTASLTMPRLGPEETVVLESLVPDIWVSEAMTERQSDVLQATADMVGPGGKPFALDRQDLRITVLAGGRAVETYGCQGG